MLRGGEGEGGPGQGEELAAPPRNLGGRHILGEAPVGGRAVLALQVERPVLKPSVTALGQTFAECRFNPKFSQSVP